MAGRTIMVIEDDAAIREVLRLYLEKNGFSVIMQDRGDEALSIVRAVQPALIILDVVLPGQNGFELCKEIRKITTVPVLFVSCKNTEQDKITALAVGGDDYITKPFSPNELIARINANLRRPYYVSDDNEPTPKLAAGALQVDLSGRTVKLNQTEIVLSKKEFELLAFLASRPGKTFSHEELFREIWGQESLNDTRTIIVHVSNLRKKIEPDPANPQHIINVHGVGYKFIM
ncbi:response regulator transcription factor [Paenibacillus xerothermodurans]|uniref:DNA-binding response regulator n=1 Tax=Paenibacillus xerothermodurans TaxID=1977292 RepID=A0A2W1P2P1_PAEXE|nr:response regulator transcription factor [Paenibacillus xerothermodurans]PZE21398.1 DNA-binding response regulator [Paenibacillus xerothermodurans]